MVPLVEGVSADEAGTTVLTVVAEAIRPGVMESAGW